MDGDRLPEVDDVCPAADTSLGAESDKCPSKMEERAVEADTSEVKENSTQSKEEVTSPKELVATVTSGEEVCATVTEGDSGRPIPVPSNVTPSEAEGMSSAVANHTAEDVSSATVNPVTEDVSSTVANHKVLDPCGSSAGTVPCEIVPAKDSDGVLPDEKDGPSDIFPPTPAAKSLPVPTSPAVKGKKMRKKKSSPSQKFKKRFQGMMVVPTPEDAMTVLGNMQNAGLPVRRQLNPCCRDLTTKVDQMEVVSGLEEPPANAALDLRCCPRRDDSLEALTSVVNALPFEEPLDLSVSVSKTKGHSPGKKATLVCNEDVGNNNHQNSNEIPWRGSEAGAKRDKEVVPRKISEMLPQRVGEVTPERDNEVAPASDSECLTRRDREVEPQRENEAVAERENDALQGGREEVHQREEEVVQRRVKKKRKGTKVVRRLRRTVVVKEEPIEEVEPSSEIGDSVVTEAAAREAISVVTMAPTREVDKAVSSKADKSNKVDKSKADKQASNKEDLDRTDHNVHISENGRVFYQFRLLECHTEERNGQKQFICDVCKVVYQRSFSLKRHYLKVHINYKYLTERDIANSGIVISDRLINSQTESPGFKAQEIGTGGDLKQLQASRGSSSSSESILFPYLYYCYNCRMPFHMKDELRSHLIALDAAQAGCVCDRCGTHFVPRQILARHQVMHGGARLFFCLFCDKSFLSFAIRKRHERLHESAAFHPCSYCREGWVTLEELRQHLFVAHRDCHHMCELPEPPPEPQPPPQLEEPVEETKAQISPPSTPQVEDKTEVAEASATASVRNAPSTPTVEAELGYSCSVCSKQFTSYVSMCRHYRLAHGTGRKGKHPSHNKLDTVAMAAASAAPTPSAPPPADAPLLKPPSPKPPPSKPPTAKPPASKSPAPKPSASKIPPCKSPASKPSTSKLPAPKPPPSKPPEEKRPQTPPDPETQFYDQVMLNVLDNLENHLDGKRVASQSSSKASKRGVKVEHPKRFSWTKYNFPSSCLRFETHGNLISEMSQLDITTQVAMQHNMDKLAALELQNGTTEQLEWESRLPQGLYLKKNELPSTGSPSPVPSSEEEVPSEPELSGEWIRPRTYICTVCGSSFLDPWDLEEHKIAGHPNVWCAHHVEVEDIRSDLPLDLYQQFCYSKESQGAIGKVEPLEAGDGKCSKCGRSCNSTGELHRHMLECGGDYTWMNSPMKKKKWRPFGSRRRRHQGRRGMKRNIPGSPIKFKRKLKSNEKNDPIQQLIANLPAKRATRRALQFNDDEIKTRSQGTISSITSVSLPRLPKPPKLPKTSPGKVPPVEPAQGKKLPAKSTLVSNKEKDPKTKVLTMAAEKLLHNSKALANKQVALNKIKAKFQGKLAVNAAKIKKSKAAVVVEEKEPEPEPADMSSVMDTIMEVSKGKMSKKTKNHFKCVLVKQDTPETKQGLNKIKIIKRKLEPVVATVAAPPVKRKKAATPIPDPVPDDTVPEEASQDNSFQLVCQGCGVQLETKSAYHRHGKKCKYIKKLKESNGFKVQAATAEKEKASHNCPFCERRFTYLTRLHTHVSACGKGKEAKKGAIAPADMPKLQKELPVLKVRMPRKTKESLAEIPVLSPENEIAAAALALALEQGKVADAEQGPKTEAVVEVKKGVKKHKVMKKRSKWKKGNTGGKTGKRKHAGKKVAKGKAMVVTEEADLGDDDSIPMDEASSQSVAEEEKGLDGTDVLAEANIPLDEASSEPVPVKRKKKKNPVKTAVTNDVPMPLEEVPLQQTSTKKKKKGPGNKGGLDEETIRRALEESPRKAPSGKKTKKAVKKAALGNVAVQLDEAPDSKKKSQEKDDALRPLDEVPLAMVAKRKKASASAALNADMASLDEVMSKPVPVKKKKKASKKGARKQAAKRDTLLVDGDSSNLDNVPADLGVPAADADPSSIALGVQDANLGASPATVDACDTNSVPTDSLDTVGTTLDGTAANLDTSGGAIVDNYSTSKDTEVANVDKPDTNMDAVHSDLDLPSGSDIQPAAEDGTASDSAIVKSHSVITNKHVPTAAKKVKGGKKKAAVSTLRKYKKTKGKKGWWKNKKSRISKKRALANTAVPVVKEEIIDSGDEGEQDDLSKKAPTNGEPEPETIEAISDFIRSWDGPEDDEVLPKDEPETVPDVSGATTDTMCPHCECEFSDEKNLIKHLSIGCPLAKLMSAMQDEDASGDSKDAEQSMDADGEADIEDIPLMQRKSDLQSGALKRMSSEELGEAKKKREKSPRRLRRELKNLMGDYVRKGAQGCEKTPDTLPESVPEILPEKVAEGVHVKTTSKLAEAPDTLQDASQEKPDLYPYHPNELPNNPADGGFPPNPPGCVAVSPWSTPTGADPTWPNWGEPSYENPTPETSLGCILGSVNQVLQDEAPTPLEQASERAELGNYFIYSPFDPQSLSELQEAMGATSDEMNMLQQLGELGAAGNYTAKDFVYDNKESEGSLQPMENPDLLDLDNPYPPPKKTGAKEAVDEDGEEEEEGEGEEEEEEEVAEVELPLKVEEPTPKWLKNAKPHRMRYIHKTDLMELLGQGKSSSPVAESGGGMRAVYGKTEMVCPTCGRRFLGLEALEQHINKFHKSKDDVSVDKPKEGPNVSKEGVGAPLKRQAVCFVCRELYTDAISLGQHITREHLKKGCEAEDDSLKSQMSNALGGLLQRALNSILDKGKKEGGGRGQKDTISMGLTFPKLNILTKADIPRVLAKTFAAPEPTSADQDQAEKSIENEIERKKKDSMWEVPYDQRAFICPICCDRFVKISSRNRHIALAHRERVQFQAPALYNKPNTMPRNATASPNLASISGVGKVFKKESMDIFQTFLNEAAKDSKDPAVTPFQGVYVEGSMGGAMQCALCDEKYATDLSLLKHARTKHKEWESDMHVRDGFCHFSFMRGMHTAQPVMVEKSYLISNVEPCHADTDSDCGSDTDSEGNFLCSECGISFYTPHQVLRHMNLEHVPSVPSAALPPTPSICTSLQSSRSASRDPSPAPSSTSLEGDTESVADSTSGQSQLRAILQGENDDRQVSRPTAVSDLSVRAMAEAALRELNLSTMRRPSRKAGEVDQLEPWRNQLKKMKAKVKCEGKVKKPGKKDAAKKKAVKKPKVPSIKAEIEALWDSPEASREAPESLQEASLEAGNKKTASELLRATQETSQELTSDAAKKTKKDSCEVMKPALEIKSLMEAKTKLIMEARAKIFSEPATKTPPELAPKPILDVNKPPSDTKTKPLAQVKAKPNPETKTAGATPKTSPSSEITPKPKPRLVSRNRTTPEASPSKFSPIAFDVYEFDDDDSSLPLSLHSTRHKETSPKPESKAMSETELESTTKSDAEQETEPSADPQHEADSQPEVESQPEPEPKAETESQVKSEPEMESEPKKEPKQDLDSNSLDAEATSNWFKELAEKEGRHTCHDCGKVYKSSSGLWKHTKQFCKDYVTGTAAAWRRHQESMDGSQSDEESHKKRKKKRKPQPVPKDEDSSDSDTPLAVMYRKKRKVKSRKKHSEKQKS